MPWYVLLLIALGILGLGVLIGICWFAWQFGRGLRW
jgi:hypothetical protein